MNHSEKNALTRRDVIRGTGAVTMAALVTPVAMKAAITTFEGASRN